MTENYLVKCNRFALSDLGSQSENKHHKIKVILGGIIIMFAVTVSGECLETLFSPISSRDNKYLHHNNLAPHQALVDCSHRSDRRVM